MTISNGFYIIRYKQFHEEAIENKFVAYFVHCTVLQQTAANKLMLVISYNITTECLFRVRSHAPFCDSAAYLLDSESDR